jgi:hypothetical protein
MRDRRRDGEAHWWSKIEKVLDDVRRVMYVPKRKIYWEKKQKMKLFSKEGKENWHYRKCEPLGLIWLAMHMIASAK